MPRYEVEIEDRVLKEMRRIPVADQRRIRLRIDGLALDPRPHGCEKLSGLDAWRIRSGNWRVVYRIDDAARIVVVTRAGHRRHVYRG